MPHLAVVGHHESTILRVDKDDVSSLVLASNFHPIAHLAVAIGRVDDILGGVLWVNCELDISEQCIRSTGAGGVDVDAAVSGEVEEVIGREVELELTAARARGNLVEGDYYRDFFVDAAGFLVGVDRGAFLGVCHAAGPALGGRGCSCEERGAQESEDGSEVLHGGRSRWWVLG
ncbi:hypothetical protein BDV95DRAFT_361632 [Massariosphaeria phaeospora]|uniref:Uncharacterized protein n=1 Tax=Massariosphaeria phaeospora TaxID=100035 RepID=A0A7C8MA53_9PLEO|nr:hypothetical protein BDV95DRAFT_361632 [Massariosphaeria phaeospora]